LKCKSEINRTGKETIMKKTLLAVLMALSLGTVTTFAAASSTKPAILTKVLPTYPVSCMQAGVEGRVVVEGLINARGEIIGVNAVKAPDPELANAAVAAVSQWKFAPATKDGTPTDAVVRIPVEFKLLPNEKGELVPSVIAVN
jgi:TonB family protein